MINIRPDEISNIIRQQIESYDKEVQIDNVGTVLQIGDGIARVYGLEQVMAGELLEFEDQTVGIALNLENDNVWEGQASPPDSFGSFSQIPMIYLQEFAYNLICFHFVFEFCNFDLVYCFCFAFSSFCIGQLYLRLFGIRG